MADSGGRVSFGYLTKRVARTLAVVTRDVSPPEGRDGDLVVKLLKLYEHSSCAKLHFNDGPGIAIRKSRNKTIAIRKSRSKTGI